jgi:hypothetical protein
LDDEALLTGAARFNDIERDDPRIAFGIATPSQEGGNYPCRDSVPITGWKKTSPRPWIVPVTFSA